MRGLDVVMGIACSDTVEFADGTVGLTGPYTVMRVSPAGNDANDGCSWALAERAGQAGIDAALALAIVRYGCQMGSFRKYFFLLVSRRGTAYRRRSSARARWIWRSSMVS